VVDPDDETTTQDQGIAEGTKNSLDQSKQQRRSNAFDPPFSTTVVHTPSPLFKNVLQGDPLSSVVTVPYVQAQETAINEYEPEELNERAVAVIGRVQVQRLPYA
jgi:hypothetical protein